MIFDTVLNLCNKEGITIARLEKECGFGNATIRGWKESSPSVEKLKAVADYFHVSIEYLIK